jgi:hypothetical protein
MDKLKAEYSKLKAKRIAGKDLTDDELDRLIEVNNKISPRYSPDKHDIKGVVKPPKTMHEELTEFAKRQDEVENKQYWQKKDVEIEKGIRGDGDVIKKMMDDHNKRNEGIRNADPERINKIKNSLEKINELMGELNKTKKGETPFSKEFIGKRYPQAKRQLSSDDVKELDDLYWSLNRMSRKDKDWNKIQARIDKLLGYADDAD